LIESDLNIDLVRKRSKIIFAYNPFEIVLTFVTVLGLTFGTDFPVCDVALE
jgi:hypothetical protein